MACGQPRCPQGDAANHSGMAPAIAKRQGAGRLVPDVQPGAARMEAVLRAVLWVGHGPGLAAHGRLPVALADAEVQTPGAAQDAG